MPCGYVYAQEALAKYGADMRTKTCGTGPFAVETVKEGEVIIMKKNPIIGALISMEINYLI